MYQYYYPIKDRISVNSGYYDWYAMLCVSVTYGLASDPMIGLRDMWWMSQYQPLTVSLCQQTFNHAFNRSQRDTPASCSWMWHEFGLCRTERMLESVVVVSQVEYLVDVSQMQTKQLAFTTFSEHVVNYKVWRSHTDMGPVSLSVWSEPGLDLGESVIRVTFGSGPSQPSASRTQFSSRLGSS